MKLDLVLIPQITLETYLSTTLLDKTMYPW